MVIARRDEEENDVQRRKKETKKGKKEQKKVATHKNGRAANETNMEKGKNEKVMIPILIESEGESKRERE